MKKNITNTQSKYEVIIFIILMTIAFLGQLNGHQVPLIVPEIISIIITAYAVILHFLKKRSSIREKHTKTTLLLFLLPAIVIHLYSILLIVVGKVNVSFFSTNISIYAPILAAVSALYLFGGNAIKYTAIAFCLSWIISFLTALIGSGVGVIFYAINQAYFDNNSTILGVSHNLLEFHDLVLSLGLIIIFFIYTRKKIHKKDLPYIFFAIIVGLLGIKRISIIALAIAIPFLLIIKRLSDKKASILKYFMGLALMTMSFFYVISIFTGFLYQIAGNINMMGRNYYYESIKEYGELSPSYLGTGRNSAGKLLSENKGLKVNGVHSDILKMYIENGFALFTAWLIYYLFVLPICINKRFDKKTSGLYLSLITYTFILYLTDNVENYYIYQLFLTLIPPAYYLMKEKNENK